LGITLCPFKSRNTIVFLNQGGKKETKLGAVVRFARKQGRK